MSPSPPASIPSATYRLQFHRDFPFEAARQLVPYLHALGISHLYASPIFHAAPGSLHGYDVGDHNRLNPEVGSRAQFDALSAALEECAMGLILDFVPNHMGIRETTNQWWNDVLENGPSSPYAAYFDIDWKPLKRELENKVLLPILGDQYGRMLESGKFELCFEQGAFALHYEDHRLPIAPRTTRPLLQRAIALLEKTEAGAPPELESIVTGLEHLPGVTETDEAKIVERVREKEIIRNRLKRLCEEEARVAQAIGQVVEWIQAAREPAQFDAFDALLNAQCYRLAYWRVASEEINYRRFFDINTLAALHMELPEVFEAAHRLVLELVQTRAVSGLRIDHVDGLWNPRAYLEALQARSAELLHTSEPKPLYLIVEKILAQGEGLRGDWPIHGTTGYEFGASVNAVLVDGEAERAFSEIYARFLGQKVSYPELVYRGKQLTMRVSMASEVNALGQMLNRISETNRWYRDFTLNALTTAIREVIACFPVYRTYLPPEGGADADDRKVILRAIGAARRRNPALERTVFEFLRDLLLPPEENPHPVDEAARRRFVMKFQQCTGPITAKGVEDTAFYVYNRLVALNEVGGDPAVFGIPVAHFHRQNVARLAEFPHSLLATSTHDTKRSEDVRARIAALSEMPREWSRALRHWSVLNGRHRVQIEGETAPALNEETLLYQTLVGTWPLEAMSDEEQRTYARRIQDYMAKALHEAKVHSSWIEPNEAWDNAVSGFVQKILHPGATNRFLKALAAFSERIAELGAVNSLAQLVLKMTVPGVPDFYQGQELWDLSLVDPDNRRPVDFALRQKLLAGLLQKPRLSELLENWRDGRLKLFVTERLLRFRRDNAALFAQGKYTPVDSAGALAGSCIAFLRENAGRRVLVVVPRLSSRVGFFPMGEKWGDTFLEVELAGAWKNLFGGRRLARGKAPLLSDLLGEFPVAVFVSG